MEVKLHTIKMQSCKLREAFIRRLEELARMTHLMLEGFFSVKCEMKENVMKSELEQEALTFRAYLEALTFRAYLNENQTSAYKADVTVIWKSGTPIFSPIILEKPKCPSMKQDLYPENRNYLAKLISINIINHNIVLRWKHYVSFWAVRSKQMWKEACTWTKLNQETLSQILVKNG
jgi:hypothetical protein